MIQHLCNFLFGTLRGRLILGVTIIHAIMMALFIADLTARQRTMLMERQVEEATALSHTLATSTAEWIASNDIAGLQELVEAQRRYPEILFAILTNQEGRVLATTDTDQQDRYMLDLPATAQQTMLASTSALVDVITPAMLGGHHVGWARIGIGQKNASKKLAQIVREGIYYTLAAIGIGAFIAWIMGRKITTRLYAIQETIAAVRAGNQSARTALVGTDEAAAMANEFNHMLDVLAERDAKLHENERLYRSIVTAMTEGICVQKADGEITAVNPAAEQLGSQITAMMLGDDADDPQWAAIHEDGSPFPAHLHPSRVTLRTGEPQSNVVMGIQQPGETLVWLSINSQPLIADGQSTPYAVVTTFHDITGRKQAEQNIALLQFALDNVHEAAYLTDENARFLYVNEESCRVLGFTRDELLSLTVPDIAPNLPLERWATHWKDLQARRSLTYESNHKSRDGQTFPVEININYFEYNKKGYNLALARDITQRKVIEEQLLESEERLRLTLEASRIGIWDWDVTTDRWYASPLYYTMLGYDPKAGTGDRSEWLERLHPDDVAMVNEKIRNVLEREFQDYQYEARIRHADGTYRWQLVRGFGIRRDETGRVTRLLGIRMDISERKRAEEERMAHLRFFADMDQINRAIQGAGNLEQMMGDALDIVLKIFDCDRAFLLYPCDPDAPAWTVPMERTKPQYPGLFALKLDIPMNDESSRTIRCTRDSEGPVKFGPETEHPLPAETASRFGFKSYISLALHPKSGKPWLFGMHQCSFARVWNLEEERLFQEIGRRLADGLSSLLSHRDLQKSEEFLNNIVENIPNMLFVKDAETLCFKRFNRAGEQLLGYRREELLDKNDYDFFPQPQAEAFAAIDREVLNTKKLVDIPEETIHTKNNEVRILHTQKIPILDENGMPTYLLGISEDITARKAVEEALRTSRAFNRQILETVDEGFIVIDKEYRILSANKTFCNMVNLPESRIIGRRCHDIMRHNDWRCFEQGEECAVSHTFKTGISRSVTHTRQDRSGAQQYLELKSFPITDGDSNVIAVIETINDVTEKRKMEELLQQAQKMEAIGTLAGGVAHDFNNMLMVILGHTELALKQTDSGQPLFSNLQEIHKAAGRSADLTRQLLAFARKQPITPILLDLNETVEKTLTMLRRLIDENIDLLWQPGTAIWPVRMDPSQIDQILANLSVNARDAITGPGKITIRTGNATIDSAFCSEHPEAICGDYTLLALSDTGSGMDQKTIRRIFDPFFTTKELGRGTGLGLATVYGIVQQNKGFIVVASNPGQGSSFQIYLPRHIEKTEGAPEEVPDTTTTGGHETILLVEDEPVILDMVQIMLENFGYQVLTASTPDQAIQVAEGSAHEIHLLITDIIMPGMNGQELARKLLSLNPRLKCLYMSGYSGNIIARHGILDEDIHFIQKPFSMQAMAAKIREALDGK